MNNLLERLHASFFFYLLVGTTAFMKIGSYLPSAILVSTAMLFGGMGEWVAARWVRSADPPTKPRGKGGEPGVQAAQWVERPRPVVPALFIIIYTHALGIFLFYLCSRPWIIAQGKVSKFGSWPPECNV